MEIKKLQKEEIDKLLIFRQTENYIVQTLGEIELKQILSNQQKDSIKESLVVLQKEQNEFATKLQENYGNGNINIETGEFTPTQS